MANYLDLVKDLARESGTLSPAQITAVTGQTGRAEKMVGWVRKAWDNIQRQQRDWLWMRGEFTAPLIIDTPRYAATSLGLSRWESWAEDSWDITPFSLYDPDLGVSDEAPIEQISYEAWYARYVRGVQVTGRPHEWAASPTGEFCVGPIPDKAYVIRGMYVKSPQSLEANADVPEMPTRFHELIVWEARRLLLIHDGAYQEGANELPEMVRIRNELARDQLPEIQIGSGPIA